LGLGSGRFRVPTSTEYVKSPSDGASACSRVRSSASRPADGGADGGEDTDESRVWRSDGVEEMQREGAWVRARAREAARWRRPCMAAAPAAAVGPWCGVGTAAVGDEMELFGEDVEERIRWKRNIGERFGHWKTYFASDLGAPLGGQLASEYLKLKPSLVNSNYNVNFNRCKVKFSSQKFSRFFIASNFWTHA